MLKLYTNVITGKTYDENGDLFEDGMPQAFYKSTMQVKWQLCSETPDIAEGSDDTPETAWTKCTDYSQYAAVGAFLTADSDYIKRRQGTLSAAVSAGAVSTIEATVNEADFDTVPSTGVIELFDSEGESEVVKYNARSIEDGVVTFTLANGSTVERSYESGSPMDCSDEPLMQAALDGQNSDVANGLFAFKIRAFSRKLHDLVAYSNTKTIDVMGLELALFRIDSESNSVVDLERYEVDTFSIRTGLAETSANPPLTDDEANETVTLCNTLLAAGFSLQFSSDNENWHDTQVTTGDNLDTYFRFRSAGSGGTWSSGIRLLKGDKGDDGDDGDSAYVYIRYASDTSGTGFSDTPSDSLTYIGVITSTTPIATPSASDFTGKWAKYVGPKGDDGDDGNDGQRGTVTYFGTAITGTSTTAAVFDTDIADAMIGDSYLNTSTFNYYECTLGGDDTTAKWKYVGNLKGPQGDNRYLYIAYASSSSGANFSLTPSASLKYVAVKNSDTEIASPSASDFTGLWQQYIGDPGASAYVYVAYASNSSGSGFSLTPSDSLKYRAEIHTTTPISSPSSSDFSGATWVKYIGDNGTNGTNGTRGSRTNYGTAITGTSITPTSYATGISDSLVGDQYINSDTMNLYRCTTAGNASTAKWIYVGAMKGEAEAALEGVKLNGELLTPTDKVVDVNALPVVTTLPAIADTTQDVLLYKGEDNATANPPLIKGHIYAKNGSWSDSTITVIIGNTTKVLSKVGSENKWTDNGQASWEDYALLWAGTSVGPWEFVNGGSSSFYSPSCEYTTMPWDPAVSGKQWDDHDGGTPVVVVKRSFNGSWVDLTGQGGSDAECLPVVKTMPTASATSEDFLFYGGEDVTGAEKGHTYEKHVDYDDSTLGINWIGWTETLTKNQSGGWGNSLNTLSYNSSNGWWSFDNDYDGGQHSSQCANTVMPWDPSLTWYNNGGSTPITVTFTLAVPPTYSWNDISASGNEIQLNYKTVTPANKKVNIMALPIATSMPTADADAQPFVLFLGVSVNLSYQKGHLYEKNQTTSNTITVTMNGNSKTLTKQSGANRWQDSNGDYYLEYSMVRWYYNQDGFFWKSPLCNSDVMPWDPRISGQNWTDSDDYGVAIAVSDPTSYSWTDLGSILGA